MNNKTRNNLRKERKKTFKQLRRIISNMQPPENILGIECDIYAASENRAITDKQYDKLSRLLKSKCCKMQ